MALQQASFYSSSGEAKGKIDLPESLFGGEGSRRILHEVTVALQANQRQGTSATKTRGLVSGGGRKPWKQKGTGNARAGSNRSPLWRKGGIIFGPQPRSYRIDLDACKRSTALHTAFIEKAKAGQLGVIDSVAVGDGKTRSGDALLKKTGVAGTILLVLDKKNPDITRAFRNVSRVCVVDVAELNAFHVMRARQVLISKAGLDGLMNRFPKG
ncbi:MAG: 50S ribosomal protein L4 [Elusimicrobiota bacterium]|jgi:large subunit ribosomal protein L4